MHYEDGVGRSRRSHGMSAGIARRAGPVWMAVGRDHWGGDRGRVTSTGRRRGAGAQRNRWTTPSAARFTRLTGTSTPDFVVPMNSRMSIVSAGPPWPPLLNTPWI